MKMYVLLLTLLTLVYTASSQPHSPCCMKDKQFQIGFGGTVGQIQDLTPIGSSFFYELAVDVVGSQAGGEGAVIILGSETIPVKFIQVWSEKKQYTIVNGNCTVTELTTPAPTSCTPSSATFMGTLKEGQDEFTTQSWSLKPSDVGLKDGSAYLSVSDSTCTPVGLGFMGNQGLVPMTFSAGYFNFSSGIPDPKKWFDIPSSCKHEKLEIPKSGPLDGIISLCQSLIF